jgi:hypothetical protein
MTCPACKHEGDDFIIVHQIGVNNYLKSGAINEKEIYFDICICPVCGILLTDIKTILIKESYSLWI